MTRKHFVRLAKAVASIQDDATRREVGQRIGDVCADANPFFDWYKWDAACNTKVRD